MKKLIVSPLLFGLSGVGFLVLAIRYTLLKNLVAGLPFYLVAVGLFTLSYMTLIRRK